MAVIPAKEAARLIIEGRAPVGLQSGVIQLSLAQTGKPVRIPPGLKCYSLSLVGQQIRGLAPGLQIEYRLDLTDCRELVELPSDLRVSSLVLTNCTSLIGLPEGLRTNFLRLDGCSRLRYWPESAQVSCGWVRARGCAALTSIPQNLGPLASLDLRDCRQIDRIGEGVKVQSWIDIGGTRIGSLPESLRSVSLRWRGVTISPQIAFFPETLSGRQILGEANTELRRVMIERVGFEKFVAEVEAEVLDVDRDPGGERRLIRVELPDDEPIVVVAVHCPSTNRQYIIRVPPTMRSCRQAIAWTAGFDEPDEYSPIEET